MNKYADLKKATGLLARLLEIIESGDHITESHYGTEIQQIRGFLQHMKERGEQEAITAQFLAWQGRGRV